MLVSLCVGEHLMIDSLLFEKEDAEYENYEATAPTSALKVYIASDGRHRHICGRTVHSTCRLRQGF